MAMKHGKERRGLFFPEMCIVGLRDRNLTLPYTPLLFQEQNSVNKTLTHLVYPWHSYFAHIACRSLYPFILHTHVVSPLSVAVYQVAEILLIC